MKKKLMRIAMLFVVVAAQANLSFGGIILGDANEPSSDPCKISKDDKKVDSGVVLTLTGVVLTLTGVVLTAIPTSKAEETNCGIILTD